MTALAVAAALAAARWVLLHPEPIGRLAGRVARAFRGAA